MGVRALDFDDSFTSATTPSTIQLTDLYNVIIGSTGEDFITHADWDAYIADAPAQYDRILVISNYTLNTTVVLSQDDVDVEHFPGVIYTNGTAGTGFQITADRCIWDGARFSAFNGGSDTAIELTAASQFNRIRNVLFNDCDNTIVDSGSANSLLGNINETP